MQAASLVLKGATPGNACAGHGLVFSSPNAPLEVRPAERRAVATPSLLRSLISFVDHKEGADVCRPSPIHGWARAAITSDEVHLAPTGSCLPAGVAVHLLKQGGCCLRSKRYVPSRYLTVQYPETSFAHLLRTSRTRYCQTARPDVSSSFAVSTPLDQDARDAR